MRIKHSRLITCFPKNNLTQFISGESSGNTMRNKVLLEQIITSLNQVTSNLNTEFQTAFAANTIASTKQQKYVQKSIRRSKK